MTDRIRYIWQLLILSSILLILGILVIPGKIPGLPLNVYLITLLAVTLINMVVYLVMHSGIKKSDREGTVQLFAGIGIKLFLYLLYILGFWLVTKNLLKPFIIAFFALYLVFTFLLTAHLLKALNNK